MHPVLFHIGNIPISPYGILVAIGIMAAIFLATRLTRRLGMRDENIIDLAVFGIIGGIIGAKLLYVITSWDQFTNDPLGTVFSRSGLVFYGGFLGAIPVGFWYIQSRKLPLLKVLDSIAPAIPLAHAFGRVGCLFAGCCYGGVCSHSFPFAIRYPRNVEMPSVIFDEQFHTHGLSLTAEYSLPVYPTQLMESFANLILAGILIFVWRNIYKEKNSNNSGRVFFLYLIGYGIIRFIIEFFRGDSGRGLYFNDLISTSQLIALMLFALGVTMYLKFVRLDQFLHVYENAPKVNDSSTEDPDQSLSKSKKRKKKKRKQQES